MGSLVAHIYISNSIKKRMGYSDEFLLGAIMPDILKINGEDRRKTHYLKFYFDKNRLGRFPNLRKFLKENEKNMNEENLGYYAHLIEDYIWFKNIIPKIAKKKGKMIYNVKKQKWYSREQFQKDVYEDYAKIDYYLENEFYKNEQIKDINERLLKIAKDDYVKKIIEENIKIEKPEIYETEIIDYKDIEEYKTLAEAVVYKKLNEIK